MRYIIIINKYPLNLNCSLDIVFIETFLNLMKFKITIFIQKKIFVFVKVYSEHCSQLYIEGFQRFKVVSPKK